jgi:hypothetical protein
MFRDTDWSADVGPAVLPASPLSGGLENSAHEKPLSVGMAFRERTGSTIICHQTGPA